MFLRKKQKSYFLVKQTKTIPSSLKPPREKARSMWTKKKYFFVAFLNIRKHSICRHLLQTKSPTERMFCVTKSLPYFEEKKNFFEEIVFSPFSVLCKMKKKEFNGSSVNDVTNNNMMNIFFSIPMYFEINRKIKSEWLKK